MVKKYYRLSKIAVFIYASIPIVVGVLFLKRINFSFDKYVDAFRVLVLALRQPSEINGYGLMGIFIYFALLSGVLFTIAGCLFSVFEGFFCPSIWVEKQSLTFGPKLFNIPTGFQTRILWDDVVSIRTMARLKTAIEYRIIKNGVETRKIKYISSWMGKELCADLLGELVRNAKRGEIDRETLEMCSVDDDK